MFLKCPHCVRENNVAGFFWRKPGAIESPTHDANRVACGFCGQSWIVLTDPAAVPSMAAVGTGSRVFISAGSK